MKILGAFYSRDGHTKKTAEALAQNLDADIEEIIDLQKRRGLWGWLGGGRDATQSKKTKIKPVQKNLTDYDLVVVGTPIWSWNVTPAVRTFLEENKSKIKKAAFFCTEGSSGGNRAFKSMMAASGLTPISVMELKASDFDSPNYLQKITDFVSQIKGTCP